MPCQADTNTDTHTQVSMGQRGEKGWDEQMLHPTTAAMQVRAEAAGPAPAPRVLPLDLRLCLISLQRQSRDPQVSADSGLQGQGRSAVSKTRCALRRRALSFSLRRERLQTHPKSTYYYHSKQPLPFLTASSPARSLKSQSSLFAATEAPNTSNSQLTHLQSHYPLHFQGSSFNLGSDWGQAPTIKYQEHPFRQSSMRHIALYLKKKKITAKKVSNPS